MSQNTTWPEVVSFIGILLFTMFVVGCVIAWRVESRKLKITSSQTEQLKQLISRYEQLSEKSLDTQQRAAADLAELRARTAAIEQLLRTVE